MRKLNFLRRLHLIQKSNQQMQKYHQYLQLLLLQIQLHREVMREVKILNMHLKRLQFLLNVLLQLLDEHQNHRHHLRPTS